VSVDHAAGRAGEDVDASGIYTLFLSEGTPVRAKVRVPRAADSRPALIPLSAVALLPSASGSTPEKAPDR